MLHSPSNSADLFHALGLIVVDPLPYFETGGTRYAIVGRLDAPRLKELGIVTIDPDELGFRDLLLKGHSQFRAKSAMLGRALRERGIDAVVVPTDFPYAVADDLDAQGIKVLTDDEHFKGRRRQKTPAQIAGIRVAAAAAVAAIEEAGALIRALPDGLTAEQVRARMHEVCDAMGCDLPGDVVVAAGPTSAIGHEAGSGPISAGDMVIIDIWPMDRASRCNADVARTFVAGGVAPSEELARYRDVVSASLDAAKRLIRPGVTGAELFRASCEPFRAAGFDTMLDTPQSQIEVGYTHYLGHGIGLEVHEEILLGPTEEPLRAGEVLCVEPGCYRTGYGGVRFEDMVLVTEDGYELLTPLSYDL